MAVIATAGHVDHGKSALVRALTGIEPDRWAEERDRGLTIDLGYAWTTLEAAGPVAFVDVPGHQRFIGNMLAGLGPTAAVLLVVAADEGWQAQSTEHLLAIDALGIEHGLLAVTRTDLADPAAALAEARERVAGTSLGEVPAVAVSARTGAGLGELRSALDRLAGSLPASRVEGRTRMWIDRAFTIRGSGTVVTGTLGEGSLTVDDRVRIVSSGVLGEGVRVRGLHSMDASAQALSATTRAAVNLPSVTTAGVRRGDVLLTGDWPLTRTFDARVRCAEARLAEHLMLHIGTAAVAVRVRPLGTRSVRVQLPLALPVVTGDRALLRDPGLQHVVAGLEVLDVDPPALRRRGAARDRAAVLESRDSVATPDLAVVEEVRRRGSVELSDLQRRGLTVPEGALPGVRRVGGWLVAGDRWAAWVSELRSRAAAQQQADPLDPALSESAVVQSLGLADRGWLALLAADAGVEVAGGKVQLRGARPSLGAAEAGLLEIERRLAEAPWSAPEQAELVGAGLGPRQLAAAVRLGRIVRLPGDVVLLPDGPARAMRVLAGLAQPFTTSDARQALGTTRRVAIPLLEHLDARGWTRRLDATHRSVIRS